MGPEIACTLNFARSRPPYPTSAYTLFLFDAHASFANYWLTSVLRVVFHHHTRVKMIQACTNVK